MKVTVQYGKPGKMKSSVITIDDKATVKDLKKAFAKVSMCVPPPLSLLCMCVLNPITPVYVCQEGLRQGEQEALGTYLSCVLCPVYVYIKPHISSHVCVCVSPRHIPHTTSLTTLTTHHYLPPTTYHLPPTTYHLPPTTYHLPPTTYHLPPTTYHQPPTTYHLPPTPNHLPPTTYHLPPTTYHLPPTTYHLPPTTYHLPLTTYHLPPTTYHLPPTTYHLPPTTYHLPPTTYHHLPLPTTKVSKKNIHRISFKHEAEKLTRLDDDSKKITAYELGVSCVCVYVYIKPHISCISCVCVSPRHTPHHSPPSPHTRA
jgi:hypothetical protein